MWKENLKSGSGGMLRWAAAPAFCCKMGAYLTGKTGKHRFPTGCPSGRLTGLCPVFTTAGGCCAMKCHTNRPRIQVVDRLADVV